mmetsp:Transcript_30061/g.66602  ORF Transcript_30061/g.66602 Transcript_30061/m.66602 type:complete len:240 (+) Transcript_30061:50-769(+)
MLVNNQPNTALAFGQIGKFPPIVPKLTMALHVSVILVALSMAFSLFDTKLFGWHPVFMSLGYILFMTEGLISSVMFRQLDGPERVRAIQSHALLQLRAILCIIVGFAVIYWNKIIHNKQHFKSTHAKFGLATLILSVVAPLNGVVSFRKLGIIQKFPEKWQPRLKWLHRRIGALTWLLALVTIQLALPHHAVHKVLLTPLWQVSIAAIGMLMLVLMAKAQVKLKDLPEHNPFAASGKAA